jgi:hypothetical protein
MSACKALRAGEPACLPHLFRVCAEDTSSDRRLQLKTHGVICFSPARSLPDTNEGCQPLYYQGFIKPSLNLANFLALIPKLPPEAIQKDEESGRS